MQTNEKENEEEDEKKRASSLVAFESRRTENTNSSSFPPRPRPRPKTPKNTHSSPGVPQSAVGHDQVVRRVEADVRQGVQRPGTRVPQLRQQAPGLHVQDLAGQGLMIRGEECGPRYEDQASKTKKKGRKGVQAASSGGQACLRSAALVCFLSVCCWALRANLQGLGKRPSMERVSRVLASLSRPRFPAGRTRGGGASGQRGWASRWAHHCR